MAEKRILRALKLSDVPPFVLCSESVFSLELVVKYSAISWMDSGTSTFVSQIKSAAGGW
jgi:hypothetical protein